MPQLELLDLLIRHGMILPTYICNLLAFKFGFEKCKFLLCENLTLDREIISATIAETLVIGDMLPVQIGLRGEKLPHDGLVVIAVSIQTQILNFGFQLKNP